MIHQPVGKQAVRYRADIDGLRAVAVLSVLAYHVGFSFAPSGFIGVDVFFVISGYLISSIIFAQISTSSFSVIRFYERRIRRICPALFAMMAVVSVLALLGLLPSELVNYGRSMLSATASVSNFYFWRHTGYFDAPFSQPLLHTWSLAVEEQFYILFPLFLLLVRRLFPQRLRISVVVLIAASFAANVVLVFMDQTTAFYMPYTRAWELLLGTCLSLGMFPPIEVRWQREAASIAGIGMIAYADFFFMDAGHFPGVKALVPCLGTALIIGAGQSGTSLVGRMLSLRPVVFVGLISYSLYLWHWPFIVLEHMGLLLNLNDLAPVHYVPAFWIPRFIKLNEVVIPFLLAVLSWRFVERPFRVGSLKMSGGALFALTASVMILFIGFDSWVVLAGGISGRFPSSALQVASYLDESQDLKAMRKGTCFFSSLGSLEDLNRNSCLRMDAAKPNYLLLGDSHSAMLWPALNSYLPSANIMQANMANCAPLLRPHGSSDCQKLMQYIFFNFLPSHRVQQLFLVGRWGPGDMEEIAATLKWVKQNGQPVILFGPTPGYDAPLPQLLAYSIARGNSRLASQHLVPEVDFLDEQMARLARDVWHVPYVSLYRATCNGSGCTEFADESHQVPLMWDGEHLNRFGAALVVKRLKSQGELP